ncbi:MAG: hypothetical protein OHK0044_19010 [Burkholderiaceae bacterium]
MRTGTALTDPSNRAQGGAAVVASTPACAPRAAPASRRPIAIRWLVLGIAVAVVSGWIATRAFGLTASSRVAYWLGVAGGTAMLMTFLFPLRKRIPWMRHWGAAKHWFVVHMVCGIGGPLLVIVHTAYGVGSINAAVALTSMLLVAGSGIVGRFIYLHIHRGLAGAHWTLAELQAAVGLSSGEVHSKLAFAPHVERTLLAFRDFALNPEGGAWRRAWHFASLPARARLAQRRCRHELDIALKAKAAALRWDRAELERRRHKGAKLIASFLEAVVRAAQFQTYERLFSLWHVLHVPLVWMLVLSAIAHVVAVHAY